jgi:hypothetical protein
MEQASWGLHTTHFLFFQDMEQQTHRIKDAVLVVELYLAFSLLR